MFPSNSNFIIFNNGMNNGRRIGGVRGVPDEETKKKFEAILGQKIPDVKEVKKKQNLFMRMLKKIFK